MNNRSKNYHKFVATAATATLVASAIVPVAAANDTINFTDVAEQYQDSVEYLYTNDIIKGISDTQFGTQQDIKRVDVGVMLAKALYTDKEINDAHASGFTDVPARATKYINVLKENGVVNGKSASNYGANDSITRGEAALMFAKAYGIEGDVENVAFTDVSDRYKEAVAALYDYDITKGKVNNKFGTADAITRGELAIFLHKLETLEREEVKGLTVTKVNEITASKVVVTIPKATSVDEAATVEVKNAQGDIVSVNTTVIEKGDTKVTFKFKNDVDADALDGVWTVNGTEYNFTAIQQLADIMEAATVKPLNELRLVAALEAADLANVDADRASSYAAALTAEDATVNTLQDVQTIIDETNKTALTKAEKEAAAEAVREATSQTQLIKALQKFDRVNEDWIAHYEDTVTTKTTYEAIQEAIDAVNLKEVDKAIENTTAQLDHAKTVQTIALVNKYLVADEEDATETPKADRYEALGLHTLVVNVDKANTNGKFTVALKVLAGASSELDTDTAHLSLMADYRAAIQGKTDASTKNTPEKLQAIIHQVNADTVEQTLEDLNNVDETTSEEDVLELLQNEALGLEGVVADYAADYKEEINFLGTAEITQESAQKIVNRVNDSQDAEAKLAAVNHAETASDMRAALIVLTVDSTSEAYANLLTPAKLEVAELVLQAKGELTGEQFESEGDVFEAITQAIQDREDFIEDVNTATKITDMQTALDNEVVFPEFTALTLVKKNETAEAVLETLNNLQAKDKDAAFTTIDQIKVAANL